MVAFGVVVGDVFANKMPQVGFAKDDEVIEALVRVEPGKGFLLSNGKTLLQAKAFIQVQLEEIPDDIELLREIPEELAGQLVRRSDLELLKI